MMTNKMKTTVLAAAIFSAAITTGCSSTSPMEEYAEQQQKIHEAKVTQEQKVFDAVPKWFLNPPQNDTSGVYAVGTSTSNNLQFSMNHAKLNAEFTLAKTLNQEVSGRERAFMRADSNGNVESDAESVVTKFVESADIVGVNTVENEVQLNDGKYTVYTLIHLSYEQQAEILARKAGNTTRVSAKEAYAEIEAELLRRADERKEAVDKLRELENQKEASQAEADENTDLVTEQGTSSNNTI
ncbi:hypothetical protein P3447_08275 [Vibrio parahaemolyticus]|nr:hypothetical protein [Vibrio parahaemolyticus]